MYMKLSLNNKQNVTEDVLMSVLVGVKNKVFFTMKDK